MTIKRRKRHPHFNPDRQRITSLAREQTALVRESLNRATRKNDARRHRGILQGMRNQRGR